MDPSSMTGDEIVISGISGKFPNSENVKEFQKNLLSKVDCVTDAQTRWDIHHEKIPSRIGTIKGISKFDRVFFGVHGKLADCLDPMLRKLIETSYEAVADAGVNPRTLRGSKSAVFTGSSFSESEKSLFYEKVEQNGFGLMGASRAMVANRISFFLGLVGPSINVDSSCCGGATALEQGYKAIKEGRAESAIIGACNVVLHPHMSLQLFMLGLLSPDGVTKSFDNAADGYTRSEGIVVFFLQKARDAKRIYAELKNIHSSYGSAKNRLSVLYPSPDFQANLMKTTLEESGLSAKDISFIEADGSGIKDADAAEVEAIDQVYNEGRKSPLLIGSVKSNIGSCSPANPLSAIVKVVTAMESGFIPPNLHYKESSDKIPALKEGRVKVVTEPTPWTGSYAAINSMAMTGSFSNIILKCCEKEKKNGGQPEDNLSRLIIASGCTEEAVETILNDMESRPVDVEMVQLLSDLFEVDTPAHLYRGYTLLPPRGLPKTKVREIQFNTSVPREIWYLFSGMGSQWVGMGEALLKLPVFADAIKRCDAVLKPRDVDIYRIITEKDPKMFDNIVNSFVGIAAIQIGLVDLLTSIGLKPDFIIGHSVGELGCAYADGCFTAEQMILSALSRGLASVETKLPTGSMAAVGLGYDNVLPLCPPDIDVACHNGPDSTTISGPADSMKKFVADLTAKGIFAKEVACSNIAYHSRYIASAGGKLKEYLQKVIPNPRPRSDRWVSSSVPRDEWNSAKARLSSAEYHTNNLLSPVLFAEASRAIPANAIVIEIAPHGLLQAIVRKSLPESVINVPLTKRGHQDNTEFLMGALGKIYNTGLNINVSKLYPKVSYPVSRGTPSISSLIKWDHSLELYTNFYEKGKQVTEGEMNFAIELTEDKWKFMGGNKIHGKVVLPISAYLDLTWTVFKSIKEDTEIPVVFENVQIHKQQIEIADSEPLVLVVMVQKGTGTFEITNTESLLCSGSLRETDAPEQERIQVPKKAVKAHEGLSESDVYTELQMRGLQCSGDFRSIRKSSANGSNGILVWKNQWITFLEGMIQIRVLGNDVRGTQVPIKIRKIIIDLKQHKEATKNSSEIPVINDQRINVVTAAGVQIEGISLTSIQHEPSAGKVIAEEIKMIRSTDSMAFNLPAIFRIILQLLAENSSKANIIRLVNDETADIEKIKESFQTILENTPESSKFKVDVVPTSWLSTNGSKSKDAALLVLRDIRLCNKNDLSSLVSDGSFLLSFAEPRNETSVLKTTESAGLGLVLKKLPSSDRVAILLRRKRLIKKTSVLEIIDEQDWTNQIRSKLNSKDCDRLILAIRTNNCAKLYENLEILQKEADGSKIRIVHIQDPEAPRLSLLEPLYQAQLELDLKLNVLLPGKIWGTYRSFPISSNLRQVSNWKASQLHPSDLDSISWVKESSEVEKAIKVEYSAVNRPDILIATGESNSENSGKERLKINSFGLEYSGIDPKGTRVMGISAGGTLSNFTSTDADYIWTIPENWSLEDAATVPLAYTIANISLHMKGELKKKESVLIYNGSCAFGQAAINLALKEESRVFTMYVNESEKKLLRSRYPNIPESNIINITSIFADQILKLTEGKGVDVVVYNGNDLKKIEACLTCVKNNARIIVLGDLPGAFSESVGMEIFLREAAIFSVIPKKVMDAEPATRKKLAQLVKNGVASGVVKPLPRNVYSREMLKNAFVDGAIKKNYGKMIVKLQPQDSSKKALAVPRFLCKTDGSYLIIDGLTDFGLELADFLVVRGAKNIVIASGSKNTRAYTNFRVSLWRGYGVRVVVREELDLSKKQNVQALLKEATSLGKVDAIFDIQRIDNSSKRTSSSKDLFTKFLVEVSKESCPALRQLVIFSAAKTNSENLVSVLLRETVLVKLCEEKYKEGSPGLLVLLGPMEGIVESKTQSGQKVPLLAVPRSLEQLDHLIGLNASVVAVSYQSFTKESTQVLSREKNSDTKNELSLFEEYINKIEPLSSSRFRNLDV
ncbi:fatty acid synthase-like [Belonocnema kinseyi]|uniref:fatty acid synthase-like n=1 Tax=Belonocnema kinseyi TaxID=2817044 RepID=UPI00143D9C08|nr:fatty acid synthase-like [Belonocnema kinseyi]